MRFDLGTLDSGERSLSFGLLVLISFWKLCCLYTTDERNDFHSRNKNILRVRVYWQKQCLRGNRPFAYRIGPFCLNKGFKKFHRLWIYIKWPKNGACFSPVLINRTIFKISGNFFFRKCFYSVFQEKLPFRKYQKIFSFFSYGSHAVWNVVRKFLKEIYGQKVWFYLFFFLILRCNWTSEQCWNIAVVFFINRKTLLPL